MLKIREGNNMFFKEYCEFIEALYCVRYSSINEVKKVDNYKEIYNEYLKTGEKNIDFEEIYNGIMTGVVYAFKPCDLEYLRQYNGLLLSISKLLSLKIKIHYLEQSQYVEKLIPVLKKAEGGHCLQCDNKDKNFFYSFKSGEKEIMYCTRCIQFGRCDNFFAKFYINIPFTNFNMPSKPSIILSDLQAEASKKVVENNLLSKRTLV